MPQPGRLTVAAHTVAVYMLTCCCAWLLATSAHAASSPQNTQPAPSKNATKPHWNFPAPDRSAQDARWRESISATLQQTTFAPSAPAGRYLQYSSTKSGKRLPPADMNELDAIHPPEHKKKELDSNTPIRGEFSKQSTSWRPLSDPSDTAGTTPALREERRAAAYAYFQPAEDVALKLGPELNLGTTTPLTDQTGHYKDNYGGLGMGMQLKIDF